MSSPFRLNCTPAVHLLFRFVLVDAVLLLDLSDQLIALSRDDVKVAVGELSPLLLHLAFELFPVAFDTIPVHTWLLI
jgi:hypothetical protein